MNFHQTQDKTSKVFLLWLAKVESIPLRLKLPNFQISASDLKDPNLAASYFETFDILKKKNVICVQEVKIWQKNISSNGLNSICIFFLLFSTLLWLSLIWGLPASLLACHFILKSVWLYLSVALIPCSSPLSWIHTTFLNIVGVRKPKRKKKTNLPPPPPPKKKNKKKQLSS